MVAQEFLVLSVGVRIPAGLPLFSKVLLTFTIPYQISTFILSGNGGRSKGLKVGGGGGGGGMLSKPLSVRRACGGVLNTSPSGTSESFPCVASSSVANGSNGVPFASGAGLVDGLLNGLIFQEEGAEAEVWFLLKRVFLKKEIDYLQTD